jgi:LacI family transcriptional regulator
MITMRDVAERAGVSVTTVSHVINKTRPVSDELRHRVLVAMEELDYQPNLLARSLRRGQTHTIGVIVPDSANPYFADVTRGIEDASFEQGYSVILCNSDGDADKEQMYTDVLVEKQVDGILFVSIALSAEQVCSLQDREMPVVVVNRDIPHVAVDTVLPDNAHGGYLATRHLVELGHRRIGCIMGRSDVTPSAERVDGYRRALQEAALPLDEMLIVKGNYQYEGGYHAARELLLLNHPPTAIFACNDLMAVGAMRAAQELGQRIPTDLSLVGYDDVQLTSFTTPPLTTISQPRYDIGIVAATMLLERMHNWDLPPRRRVADVSLLVRQSTAVPVAMTQKSMSRPLL